jgi:hypothetical protein
VPLVLIITRAVLDWDGNVLEQESFEYHGPVAAGKSAGSAPQPTDPYTQANAQMGLATGTADYNAALNHTDSSNALGSNSWQITGTDPTSGAPIYGQQTSLSPWANSMLSSPIDTTGLAGMPGGPSTTQDLATTRNSLYDQQEAYIKPQQDLAAEQLDSKLANEGIMPGSAAYQQAKDEQNRANTFTNNQTINSAITGGGAEQSRLFGLGSQGLQNQLAVRNAPISEYESLQGNPSSQVSAATPDISGAFGQQYQGALAGYNANTATNNANTTGLLSTAAMAAMMFY